MGDNGLGAACPPTGGTGPGRRPTWNGLQLSSDDTPETLASLIAAMKGRRSYADLAKESGPGLGEVRWGQLAGTAVALRAVPKFDAIQTIARVLRVSEARVWLAIGREGGLTLDEESPLLSRMPARTSVLTPKQVDLVLEMTTELVDLQLAVQELQDAPAKTPAKRTAAVTQLRAARKSTGTESRGPRGGAKKR